MARKIRILHVFDSFHMGGMESNLLHFINCADLNKFEHFIFIARDEGQLKEQYHKLPVKIITIKCTPRHYYYSLPFGYSFCKKNGIDIIHGHNYWFNRYAYLLAVLTGTTLFTSNYGLGLWKKKRHLFIESIIFRRAKINIALSKAILEKEKQLLDHKDNPHQKCKLVYPIIKDIPVENFPFYDRKKIKEKIGINNDKPILTIIGRIDRLKGHRIAIEAVEKINRDGLKINLLIVGPMSDPSILVEEDLRKGYITYLNFYEKIEEIWAISDSFLISSLSEGTPLVLIEYFAVGKPVIASAISGNEELIRDGWNGFLFKVGDVEDLVRKINFVLEDDNIQTIRDNARKSYMENHSSKMITQKIENYYHTYAS